MSDAFKSMTESTGSVGSILGLICSCACLGGVITYAVYLGIYAFNNPDPASCFYVEGVTTASADQSTVEALAVSAGITDAVAVNAHTVFVSWFVWGFWTCIAPCLAIPLFILTACMQMQTLTMALSGLLSCGVGCSQLFWIIFGSIWRFGGMGAACTRDAIAPMTEGADAKAYQTSVDAQIKSQGLQVQSGAFMKTWLIICFCFIGLKVLGCIAAVIFRPSM